MTELVLDRDSKKIKLGTGTGREEATDQGEGAYRWIKLPHRLRAGMMEPSDSS